MPAKVQPALRRFTLERWSRFGLRDGLFDELRERYAEPHRAYHTAQHIEECLGWADEAAAPAEVELALWFHDAIYDPRAHDNEERSAEWALRETQNDRVAALIMITQHLAIPSTHEEQLVVDVDLSILGAARERFAEYETQIRQEYAWVPEPIFKTERAKVLRRFLDRPSIYATEFFRSRLEEQARRNLISAMS